MISKENTIKNVSVKDPNFGGPPCLRNNLWQENIAIWEDKSLLQHGT
jgi:hypothetical protein